MTSPHHTELVAAWLLGMAVATTPSLGRADAPCPSPQEILPTVVEEQFLKPVTEYLQLGLDVLGRVEKHTDKWRDLRKEIDARIDKIVPLEGRESGGARQLHPLRGTALIRQDYAQKTLGEDWFLKPSFGNAALHLDVPYDADVTITPYVLPAQDPKKWDLSGQSIPLRGQGRHRHVVLSGLSTSQPRPVRVMAELRREPPKGTTYRPISKEVYLLAGDRRHLAFSEDDFREVKTTLPTLTTATSVSTMVTRPTSTRDEQEGERLVFRPAELEIRVTFDDTDRVKKDASGKPMIETMGRWVDLGTEGETKGTLELVHEQDYPTELIPDERTGTFAVKIRVLNGSAPTASSVITNWDAKDHPHVAIFCYKDYKKKKGVAELPFTGAANDLWGQLVEALESLLRTDGATHLEVIGFVKFKDPPDPTPATRGAPTTPHPNVFQIMRFQDPLKITIRSVTE